jgi:hypothetical protein
MPIDVDLGNKLYFGSMELEGGGILTSAQSPAEMMIR